MASFDSIFDRSVPQLRELQRGQKLPIPHEILNNPIKALKRITSGVAPGRQVIGRGVPEAASGLRIRRAIVDSASVRSDYVVVHFADIRGSDDPSNPPFNAWKPWILRFTPFDRKMRLGITYIYSTVEEKRFAAKGTLTEPQVIIPTYVANDEIVIARIEPAQWGLDEVTSWIDLNVDGRMWAKES